MADQLFLDEKFKKIFINQILLKSGNDVGCINIVTEGKLTVVREVKILGPSQLVFNPGRNDKPARIHLETSSPLIVEM